MKSVSQDRPDKAKAAAVAALPIEIDFGSALTGEGKPIGLDRRRGLRKKTVFIGDIDGIEIDILDITSSNGKEKIEVLDVVE